MDMTGFFVYELTKDKKKLFQYVTSSISQTHEFFFATKNAHFQWDWGKKGNTLKPKLDLVWLHFFFSFLKSDDKVYDLRNCLMTPLCQFPHSSWPKWNENQSHVLLLFIEVNRHAHVEDKLWLFFAITSEFLPPTASHSLFL